MSIQAVFVGRDGTITHRNLEHEVYTFLVPRPQRLSVVFHPTDEMMKPSFTVDTYQMRGRMLDGRPVYVRDGFDVLEARAIRLSTPRDVDSVDSDNKRDVFGLVTRARGTVLDEWCGDWPVPVWEAEELRASGLVKRGVRMIAVVPK